MQPWNKFITQQTAALTNIRNRYPKTAASNRVFIAADNHYLNFISNDYLGLSNHPEVCSRAYTATKQYGTGSTGAASLSGYSHIQQQLSYDLANYFNFEKSLIANSGFQLNSSVFTPLIDENTQVWIDRKCHASHIDGILLAKAKFRRFDHNNLTQMVQQIKENHNYRHLIVSEGVFSMDGSCQYLPELLEIKRTNHHVLLMIDDAHGIGALGTKGYGQTEICGEDLTDIDLLVGTFGKAFGSAGGFVCGNSQLIDYLQQTIRSQIYSTCLPPAVLAASHASLQIINNDEGINLRNQLQQNITYFKSLAAELNLPLHNTQSNSSPIQSLRLNNPNQVDVIVQRLYEQKIWLAGIKYPTVDKYSPRLRISLTALHTCDDLENLCHKLRQALDE